MALLPDSDARSRRVYNDVYESKDENGNVTDRLVLKPGTDEYNSASAARNADGSNVLIRKKDGTWVSAEKSGSISLDSKTGKITVHAPAMAIQNETFQKTYKPALDVISENYKLNPNAKYALMNDSTETKTSQEWLEEISKDLGSSIETAMQREMAKQSIKKDTGLDYSDEDIAARGAVALEYKAKDGQSVLVKDDTMQALPAKVRNLNVFKNLEGWDETSEMVKWGDLKKVWDRDKVSDEDFQELYDVVDEYFKKGEFESSSEHARMTALAEFIEGKDPSVNFIRGAAENVGNTIVAVLSGAAQFNVDVFSLVEGAVNWVVDGNDILKPVRQDLADRYTGGSVNFVRDYLQPELTNWKNERAKKLKRLNDFAGGAYAIVDTLTPIGMELALSVAAGNYAAAAVKSGATNLASRAALRAASKYGTTVETMSTLTASGIASGAIAVEDIAAGMYAGLDLSIHLMTTAKFAEVANASIQSVIAASRVIGGTAKVADVLAQAVVDITLSDSKMFRKLLESGDDTSKAYALQQVTMNAAGEIAGVGIAKGLKKAGDSEVVQVLNAKISPGLYDMKAKVGQAADNLKTAIHHGDEDWLVNKVDALDRDAIKAANGTSDWAAKRAWNKAAKAERQLQNLGERRILRQAGRKVAEFAQENPVKGSTWEELLESAKKVNSEKKKLIAEANLAIDAVYRGDVSGLVARFMRDDTKLKGSLDAFLDSQSKLIKIEDSMGLNKGAKLFDLSDGKTTHVLDKATNEYVASGYRLRIAEAIRDYSDIPENVTRAKKEIEHFEEVVKTFEETQPAELVEAAKDLRQKAMDLSAATQDLRIQQTVLSKRELQRVRESGFFDEGYMRTQRIKDWNEYYKRGGRLHISEPREMQHFKLGNVTDPFQDVSLVLANDINEVARQVNRKKAVAMLKDIGMPVKVVVDGNTTRIVKEINPIKDVVTKKIAQNTEDLVKNNTSTLYIDTFKRGRARTDLLTLRDEALSAGASLKKAETVVPKTTIADRKNLIRSLEGDELDDLVTLNQDSPFAHPVVDEESFKDFRKNLNNETRKFLDERIDAQEGYLFTTTGNGVGRGGKSNRYTLENFQKVVDNDPDFITELKRTYAASDKGIYDSKQVTDTAARIKKEKAEFDARTAYRAQIENIRKFQSEYDLDGMDRIVMEQADEFIQNAKDVNANDKTIMDAMDSITDATTSKDDALEYATMRSLNGKRKAIKDQVYIEAKNSYNTMLTDFYKKKYPGKENRAIREKALRTVDRQADTYAKQTAELIADKIEQRYGEISSKLIDRGSPIVDKRGIFAYVSDLNKEITNAAANSNIIKTYDAFGQEEYVEVSPTVASMFTTMPRQLRRGAFGEIQQAFCRLFRLGTTGGLVPGSLVSQFFRDTGNALTSGDAWKNAMEVEDELVELFGERLAKEYQETVPDVFETLLKQADETGEDVARLAVRKEIERGTLNVASELETNLYQFGKQAKNASKTAELYDQSNWDKVKTKFDKAVQVTDTANNIRESWLRERVYNNNFLKALKEGMSTEEARTVAEFMQAEATTNFVRKSYHLANLAETVPYLGSAINGAKSFWRLYAFDPAGVTARIIGGYVVPVMALTNMTLSNPEDRRIFQQIPEYEKQNNIVFVLDGQIFSIPVPQEISAFVTPVQHAIESAQGASKYSFSTLMANDLLGSFPVDLSGFMNIDADEIIEQDIWTRNLAPGISKVASTLMPPLVKSGVMMVTGVDPYTMKPIAKDRIEIDPSTGQQVVMDYNSGNTAKWIGSIMGDFMSAPMAQKVLQNLIGKGGLIFTDGIGALAQAVIKPETAVDQLTSIPQSIIENATDRLTVSRYGEESNMAWNRAVNTLWEEKRELLNDKSYQEDIQALNGNNLTEEAKKTVESRVRTKQQEFMQKVLKASQNLVSKYDGTFDRYKFAAVLSLMNMDSENVNENPFNSYSTYLSKQEWNVNKAAAVESMAELGFTGPNDGSIFGYYAEDEDGNIAIKYNSPISILNFEYSNRYQDEIAFSDINQIINDNNLYQEYDAYNKQIQAIYDKKKKTKQDYANIEQLQINWNSHVASLIAPIVAKTTPEAAINNTKVRNLLYPYIYVPSSYEVNNKGRYVSLGDNGSKKAAYYDSFIKRMFGVNDKYKGQY